MFLKDGNAITHSLSPYQHHSRFARKFIYICFTICKTNFFRICGTNSQTSDAFLMLPFYRCMWTVRICCARIKETALKSAHSTLVRWTALALCHGQVWSQRWRHDLGSIILTLLNKAHLISITRRLNVRLCLREWSTDTLSDCIIVSMSSQVGYSLSLSLVV